MMHLRTLTLIALLLPVTGYCDSGSGWFNGLFKSKAEKEKDVAVKVAELPEKYKINVHGLDFSPDGKQLAVVSSDEFINIWDWRSGHIVRTVEKIQGANDASATEPIRYSPDGRLFVSCHDRSRDVVIRIWHTETWEVVHDIVDFNYGSCSAIGFTPDGKSLIGVLDRNPTKPGDNLIIYDATSWQPVWGLRTVPFYPKALSISPNGKFVAIGGGI
jgi:WD40 repeat protein